VSERTLYVPTVPSEHGNRTEMELGLIAESASIRARLAETERERADCVRVSDVARALGVLEDIDTGRDIIEAAQSIKQDADRWSDEAIGLRARLAEAEAERDRALQARSGLANLLEGTEAREEEYEKRLDHYAQLLIEARKDRDNWSYRAEVASVDLAQAREELAATEARYRLEVANGDKWHDRVMELKEELAALRSEVEGDNGLRASAAAGWAIAKARLAALDERAVELAALREATAAREKVIKVARLVWNRCTGNRHDGFKVSGALMTDLYDALTEFESPPVALSKLSALPGAIESAPNPPAAECTKQHGCRASKHSFRCPELPPISEVLADALNPPAAPSDSPLPWTVATYEPWNVYAADGTMVCRAKSQTRAVWVAALANTLHFAAASADSGGEG
jgi:hypothetical protein